ncbi:MAG: hypothetical protein OEV43_02075 [Coriobacteriia bacterium]|nr:hypothetical protein [Coriobacteriia bacterium]
MSKRPDVTDEDIGMRAFQLKKGKAVERSVQRMRRGLKDQWGALTNPEVEELEWILGELWAYVARAEWEELHFGKLSLREVRDILKDGRDMRTHARNAVEVLNEVKAIVVAKG